MTIQDIIDLSELLATMGHIKRSTKLPDGEYESDSHHSFSLAVISYQIVTTKCPELSSEKVMKYALCHDLLEIITGDVETLHFTPEQHDNKHSLEQASIAEFQDVFERYPDLLQAMHEYERLDTPEAAAVFVLDKACTTWTYHSQPIAYAHDKGLYSRADVDRWAQHTLEKFDKRLKHPPPQVIMDIFHGSHKSLSDLMKN